MKRLGRKKLTLSRTTLRALNPRTLEGVVGGVTYATCTELCTNDNCNTCQLCSGGGHCNTKCGTLCGSTLTCGPSTCCD